MNPSAEPRTSDAPKGSRRVPILGVAVNAIDLETAVETVAGWIRSREKTYVCVTPVAGIMACQRDGDLRRIFNASGMTTPDGTPVVWVLRLLGESGVGRVYGPDLVRAVCRSSTAEGWRHYFYGGEAGVAQRMAARMRAEFPALTIAGAASPPHDWDPMLDEGAALRAINDAQPDVVWVGLSTPKQERWMAARRPHLRASVLVGVGAAFDFLSGEKPQAPRWMHSAGLEWVFRLASEPRRLWRRYLIDNPLFVILVTMQLLGLRRSVK